MLNSYGSWTRLIRERSDAGSVHKRNSMIMGKWAWRIEGLLGRGVRRRGRGSEEK